MTLCYHNIKRDNMTKTECTLHNINVTPQPLYKRNLHSIHMFSSQGAHAFSAGTELRMLLFTTWQFNQVRQLQCTHTKYMSSKGVTHRHIQRATIDAQMLAARHFRGGAFNLLAFGQKSFCIGNIPEELRHFILWEWSKTAQQALSKLAQPFLTRNYNALTGGRHRTHKQILRCLQLYMK